MELETVRSAREGAVAIISLNRPDVLNALNRALARDLHTALERVESDPEVRVVILRGEGRAFCAGADLKEEDTGPKSPADLLQRVEGIQNVSRAMLRMPQPVIGAIHGYAIGAGCEWCLNCDIRIAAEGTQFAFPETKWGLFVTNAGTKLLPEAVGLGRAKELVFTGDRIDAEQAERWGLVNRVVPENELLKEAHALAERIAANSPFSVARAKRALGQGSHSSFEEVFNQETSDALLCVKMAEGPSAREMYASEKSKRT